MSFPNSGVVPGIPADPLPPEEFPRVLRRAPAPRRLWLHAALLFLTLITTSAVGASFAEFFEESRPINVEENFLAFLNVFTHPALLVKGLPFSIPLLTILLAHEFGHYLACFYYGIDATLPFFLPAPTPLIGTLGAFIRIRSPIYSKRVLFDIGIAGPLAGFAVLLPVMAVGVAWSRVVPGVVSQGDVVFGHPLVLRLFEWMVFPGVPPTDISLHPLARAAWMGVMATALNLLPIGQLDGGHILYAFLGELHRPLSRLFIAVLVPIGIFFSYNWLIWAVILFFFGMRHPLIFDRSPVGGRRTLLGWLALVLFLLSFTLAPIRTNGV